MNPKRRPILHHEDPQPSEASRVPKVRVESGSIWKYLEVPGSRVGRRIIFQIFMDLNGFQMFFNIIGHDSLCFAGDG